MSVLAESTKRAITPKDWKGIEGKLMHTFNTVKLTCDGYKLSISLVRVSQFKNVLHVYVDGVIKGEWFMEDCEERRRFFRPRSKQLHSVKELLIIKKISAKRYKEILAKNTYYYYDPRWTSLNALKSHLIKNNKVIEVISDDELDSESDDELED